jgi:DNA-binding transcriptional ArsR family regulator
MSRPEQGVDWERVARGFLHPLKLGILDALAADGGQVMSPVEFHRESGEPLGNVSYHFNGLFEAGLLELTDTQPRRGAVEHYYRLKAEA